MQQNRPYEARSAKLGRGRRRSDDVRHDVASKLYLPLYLTRPQLERDAVLVVVLNESRPSAWDQVSDFIDKHGSISNADVRKVITTGDVLSASKLRRTWVSKGVLNVMNPAAAKQHRRYTKPSTPQETSLFSNLPGKQKA